jgi:hypothetical protein
MQELMPSQTESDSPAAEDIERLELTLGERCNELPLDTGLFIVSAVSG